MKIVTLNGLKHIEQNIMEKKEFCPGQDLNQDLLIQSPLLNRCATMIWYKVIPQMTYILTTKTIDETIWLFLKVLAILKLSKHSFLLVKAEIGNLC